MDRQIKELPWLVKACSLIGTREIKGSKHNKKLLSMLKDMGKYSSEHNAWWNNDEVPWCGLFVAWCLGESGRYVVKNWFRAKAWADSGLTQLNRPAYGCIVVFSRKGGGHVGFVVGEDKRGYLMVLGGNQSDAVNIKPFSKDRVLGYFWASKWEHGKAFKSTPYDVRYDLPILDSNGKVSINEQ